MKKSHDPSLHVCCAAFGSEISRAQWNWLLRLIWHSENEAWRRINQTSETLTDWYIILYIYIYSFAVCVVAQHAFISVLILKSNDKISSTWAGVSVSLEHKNGTCWNRPCDPSVSCRSTFQRKHQRFGRHGEFHAYSFLLLLFSGLRKQSYTTKDFSHFIQFAPPGTRSGPFWCIVGN